MTSKLTEIELNYKDVSKDIENDIGVEFVRAAGKLEHVRTIQIDVEQKKIIIKFKKQVSFNTSFMLLGLMLVNNVPCINFKDPYFYEAKEKKIIAYVGEKEKEVS